MKAAVAMHIESVQKHIKRLWPQFLCLNFAFSSLGQDALAPADFNQNGWFRVLGSVPSDKQNRMVYEVYQSGNLTNWRRSASAHHWPFTFEDASTTGLRSRFYGLRTRSKTTKDDWKNLIVIPGRLNDRFVDEPFFARASGTSLSQPSWIKFAIVLNQPESVVFQDSKQYAFHYEFARRRLEGFSTLSRQEFDAASLHPGDHQQIVLGAVLDPRNSGAKEAGIQLVGLTPYPKEAIVKWFRLVQSAVNTTSQTQFFYMPTFDQSGLNNADIGYLAEHGILVSSADRWLPGNGVYSEGWTLGTVRYVESGEIDEAFAVGRLRPDDILLTDGVPPNIPMVAGIVSLSPATPNSHVAILSQSFGIPFVYLRDGNDRSKIQNLVGAEVYAAASTGFFFNSPSDNRVRIVPIQDSFDPNLKQELLDLKLPQKLDYVPKKLLGQFHKDVTDLTLDDVAHFGGKASNFGLLRREIPDRSPEAIAFSFDLWDAFMERTLSVDGTLREKIQNKLIPFSWPVTDSAAIEKSLTEIRSMIKDASFTPTQQQTILDALTGFRPEEKIRFRSSTNVEDSDTFVGAGLYDSFSGCVLDDTDGDTTGPSGCDPTKPKERGVFRAIKRVYASFYNLNAFLQRLQFGVDENEVGMGILVHHSFPDEIELANGVAVVRESFGDRWEAKIVAQKGAISVSNPEGGALPEVVTASGSRSSISSIWLNQPSNLVAPGANVMEWETDYRALSSSLFELYSVYRKLIAEPSGLQLDFEFKKVKPGEIVFKQVRLLPPAPDREIPPFFLNEPIRLATFQGESFQGFFGRHRLKSRWRLEINDTRLTETSFAESPLKNLQLEYLDGTALKTIASPVEELSNFSHAKTDRGVNARWDMDLDGEDVSLTIEMEGFPNNVSLAKDVAVTLQDLRINVTARYKSGRPEFVFRNGQLEIGTTTEDRITLAVDTSTREPTPRVSLQTRSFAGTDSKVHVVSKFYWPPPPSGPSAGYTASVYKWEQTEIRGIMEDPIILRGFYSQTYLPGHHNFFESFIFDPKLEQGLSAEVLELLERNNVDKIVCDGEPGSTGSLRIIGVDGKLRGQL